jgi:hypothetical protein
MNSPNGMPEPEKKGSALVTFGTVLLWLCVVAVVLSVLVFGTCLLLLRH